MNGLKSLDILNEQQNPELISNLLLNNNRLNRLYKNDFYGFIQLTELRLDFNEIEYLEFNCFNSLNNLTILKLNNNHLTQLLTGQFYNLVNLKQLDLSRNEIKFVDAFNLPFLNLFHLFELDLTENNLQNVYSLTFSNLLRLRKLVLNNANINDIENDAFSNSFDLLLCTNNNNTVTMIYLHQNPINFNYLTDGLCFKLTMNDDYNDNSKNSILYPFGKKENDKTMLHSDDYYEGPIQIQTEFKFYNKLYSFLYINTNGFISFENPLDSLMKPLVSPFNADINTLISGSIYYREVATTTTTTNDLLNKITNDINTIDVDFNATWAFVVTWFEVSAFDGDPFENNTFQVVLTSCKANNKSFVLFNYGRIMWFHDSVKAGFDSGDRINLFYLINGSSSLDVINLSTTSNVNQAGKNVFRVDNGFSYPSFSESNEKPSNCNKSEQNGIYSIYLNSMQIKVYCQSNGWIRIMNRVNSITNEFNRTIQEYKNGFGDLESNYWLGLGNIQYLTSQSSNERILLRIEFKSVYSDEYFIEYDNFKLIGNDYELNIGKVTNGNLIEI